MGYSEIHCQICGMSFNIARVRTPTEPRSAGWNTAGYSMGGFVPSSPSPEHFCPPSAGCLVIKRDCRYRPARSGHEFDLGTHVEDEDEDGDYEYQSSGEVDPYEYDSQSESDAEGDGIAVDRNEFVPQSSDLSETYERFIQSLSPATVVSERLIPQHEAPQDEKIDYEHIAGGLECQLNEHCYVETAFNGHAISVEEMRGCNTLQCFVPKSRDWKCQPGDQDFEQCGDFFLSGLSDYAPSRDDRWPRVYPVRHGCESPQADNTFYMTEDAASYAMPFHPTCLEVFKRVSYLREGKVDYEGLINWWILENEPVHEDFPRDPAVANCQWFEHQDGNEFVAANPCFMPKLDSILTASGRSDVIDFSYGAEVFGGDHSASKDIFSALPQELLLMVLGNLESKDIANLRMASRSFHSLPQSFFRSLTLRELPWLWEAWSDMRYSDWAYPKASELQARDVQLTGRLKALREAVTVLEQDARDLQDAALHQSAISALQQTMADENARLEYPPTPLPLRVAEKTDWYQLRCELARSHTLLLGLRNRRRIWKDCEEILVRIGRYREAGKIIPGQTVNARAVAEEAANHRREHNRRWNSYCAAGRPGHFNFDDWA